MEKTIILEVILAIEGTTEREREREREREGEREEEREKALIFQFSQNFEYPQFQDLIFLYMILVASPLHM